MTEINLLDFTEDPFKYPERESCIEEMLKSVMIPKEYLGFDIDPTFNSSFTGYKFFNSKLQHASNF